MAPLPFEVMCIATIIGSLSLLMHIVQVKIPLGPFEKLEEKIGIESGNATQVADSVFAKISAKLKREDDDSDDDNFKRIPARMEESSHVPDSPKNRARSANQPQSFKNRNNKFDQQEKP